MPTADIVFIHPPTFYDFRKQRVNYGLMSRTVSSTPIFEYFPVGFLSLSHALKASGRTALIVNLGNRMLLDRAFDVPQYLSHFTARCFGVSFHWLTHAQGAIEVTKILKTLNPRIPVVVGGISASYFHEELIRHPSIDFVIRGDSAELPLVTLMQYLEGTVPIEKVPNLTWKVGDLIRVNPTTCVPESVDVRYDYDILLDCMLSSGCPEDVFFTSADSLKTFATVVPFVRGCKNRCATCGGSNYALRRTCIGARPPASVVEDIATIRRFQPHEITIYGDVRQGDWTQFLKLLHSRKLGEGLRFEFSWPASRSFVGKLGLACPRFRVMMSPETHDEAIRGIYGRRYSNLALESTIERVINAGGRVVLFFMVGLPHQDDTSVRCTLDYIDRLFERYNRIAPCSLDANIGPLAPFIDPGSPAFEHPSRYGYTLRFRTLDDYVRAGALTDWREMFNYESVRLDRLRLAETAWIAGKRLIDLRQSHGLLSEREADAQSEQLTYGSRLG